MSGSAYSKAKTTLRPFRVGTVRNPLDPKVDITNKSTKPVLKQITIEFPSRLNAMAIDPSRVAINRRGIYTAGEVLFSINVCRRVRVSLRKDKVLNISEDTRRTALVKHAFLIMRKAINFREGMNIHVDNTKEIRHAGLGSSSCLIAAVACAISEIYGSPIDKKSLLKYLARNHGEEIDGVSDYLCPTQCLGGSAASGLYQGGLIVIAGENNVISVADVPNRYSVIIGIPEDYKESDAETLMKREIRNMKKFIKTGERFGHQIAYNVLHIMLPAISEANLKKVGDVIYDYRFNMGSIKNCSYTYPQLPHLTDKLSYLKKEGLSEILSISSVGPVIFAIAERKNKAACVEAFRKMKLSVFTTSIHNEPYKILDRIRCSS